MHAQDHLSLSQLPFSHPAPFLSAPVLPFHLLSASVLQPLIISFSHCLILPFSALQWNRTTRKPGAQPHITDQGSLNSCSTHSLAKYGFDIEFQETYDKLIAIHGTDQEDCKKSPHEFHNTEVTVEVASKVSPLPKQIMTIKIEVQTTNTRASHWEDPKNSVVSSPRDFIAIGCLETPNGNHAVYIKSYDPNAWEVQTINSHGGGGELGLLNDTATMVNGGRYEFYQVDLIRLTNVQPTQHQPLDPRGQDVPDCDSVSPSVKCQDCQENEQTIEQMKKKIEELEARPNSSSPLNGCLLS